MQQQQQQQRGEGEGGEGRVENSRSVDDIMRQDFSQRCVLPHSTTTMLKEYEELEHGMSRSGFRHAAKRNAHN